MDRDKFKDAKRIVIKFGTNVLTNDEGQISLPRVYSFIEDVHKLKKQGKEIILVTSGAVGLGKKKLGIKSTVAMKQACAAIGQSKLMSIYEDAFEQYNQIVAQILLVEEDFSQRMQYLSIQTTLNKLLELGVIPIINQNDTVSPVWHDDNDEHEACFADNDKLSAIVASALNADMLVILSDIDALYDSNPKDNPNAKPIYEVEELTDKIISYASGVSNAGRGGMKTKLEAAKLVTRSGGTVVIASGMIPSVLLKIFNGERLGTLFLPKKNALSGKKRWIGYSTNIYAKLVVDNGAKKAILENEKSLLPIGVLKIINEFSKGDVVSLIDESMKEFARGIVNYNSNDCKKIIGKHSDNMENLIGHKGYDAIITRDNITVL
ncbi:MAG: glutamate 5-kinase [Candidatus Melainabacteria bacterium]|nr:MAG: glutamate 5-kinase [Candidatus Melainabacteria bacterium]